MKNIILLRGLVRESRHWGSFPDKLNNELSEFNVMTPEIQGVGKYKDQVSPDNFDAMIDFMREQIKDQLSKESIICAISLGGMMAKRWIEKYPDDFRKMILINTSYKGINPIYHRLKPGAIFQFLKIFLTPQLDKREYKILKLVSNNKDARNRVYKDWIEIQKSSPVSRKSFINQIKAALAFDPDQAKPKIPLLLVASKEDRLCDVNSTMKLFQLWDGKLKLNQTAGHDIPLDDPQWLIKTIKEFVQ